MTRVRYEVDGWGVAELCADGRRVLWHELPRRNGEHPGRGENPGGENPPPPATLADEDAPGGEDFGPTLVARLRAYFAGDEVEFADVELDLDELTPFGRELARALRAVPRGEIVTYGELAAIAGRPGAARAAGSFCAVAESSRCISTWATPPWRAARSAFCVISVSSRSCGHTASALSRARRD